MVDSYGGVFPEDVIEIINLVKTKMSCKLGFHGHDNLELALVNSLTAIAHGVEIIDATVLGMGRGAGNLKTELLLTVLNNKNNLGVNFNALERAVSAISPLLKKYEWGTNLPYMISGSNSLPQKDVMDWVSTRFYSFNSIIRALDNKKNKLEDNEKFSLAQFDSTDKVLVVGGGASVAEHIDGIHALLVQNPELAIIHASAKNADFFKELPNKQYFCLVGNEGHRLESVLNNLSNFNGVCILPPYPRNMGTYVPQKVKEKTFELEAVNITDKFKDAHTALALQIVKNIGAKELLVVGYDGYKDTVITEKEKNLNGENTYLFINIKEQVKSVTSLVPTYYSFFDVKSLYEMI